MDSEWGVMNYLEKSPASHEHPDSAYHMPGTELRSPAHRHRSAGAHLTHLMDHESPPGPRRPPESSPSSPGRSSSASDHRADRLSAAMAWVRAVGRRLAAGLLLLVAGLLGVSTAGQAQTLTTFVSNTNETAAAGVSLFAAQSFFTASDIVLSEIEILLGEEAGDAVAKIRENNADDRPGDLVAELTSPTTVTANSLNSFTAPAGTTLDENTTYWITWGEGILSFSDIASFTTTNSDDETGETGWEIDDNYLWKSSDSATSWNTAGVSMMIAVKGTVVGTTLSTDATLSALTVNDGTSVTLLPLPRPSCRARMAMRRMWATLSRR